MLQTLSNLVCKTANMSMNTPATPDLFSVVHAEQINLQIMEANMTTAKKNSALGTCDPKNNATVTRVTVGNTAVMIIN